MSNGELEKSLCVVYSKMSKKQTDKPLNLSDFHLNNSMTTKCYPKKTFSILWRPNNYRLKINTKKPDNSTLNSAIDSTEWKSKSTFCIHTQKISIKDYNGITIQVDKNSITGIYSQNIITNQKETYHITADSIEALNERIEQRKEEIKKQILDSLKVFSARFNIELIKGTEKWTRYEDWIKGEEYIDSLPKDMIIEDTYFKKVYETGIEFKKPLGQDIDPAVFVKNYIKNRAIEDIAPEIAKAIMEIRLDNVKDFKILSEEALKPLTAQIKLHLKVQRETLKTMKSIRKSLQKPSIWQRIINILK